MHERYPCRMCINLVYRNGQYSQNCAWRRDLWNVPTPSPLPALLGVYKQKTVFWGACPSYPSTTWDALRRTVLSESVYFYLFISRSQMSLISWYWASWVFYELIIILSLAFASRVSMISDANPCSELTMISELMLCDLWAKVKVYSDPLSELSNSYSTGPLRPSELGKAHLWRSHQLWTLFLLSGYFLGSDFTLMGKYPLSSFFSMTNIPAGRFSGY
jgi:hypothetical protein